MSTDISITRFAIKSTQGAFPGPTDLLIFHQDKAPTLQVQSSETALYQQSDISSHMALDNPCSVFQVGNNDSCLKRYDKPIFKSLSVRQIHSPTHL